jgi:DNA-binding NtrC family response regulator
MSMSFSILIVEPDFLALETTSQMLMLTGFRTVSLQTVELALGALKAISIDVAIFSSVPDDPTGADFSIAAKRIQPALKIIVATDSDFSRKSNPHANATVSKPFLPLEISALVRQLCHIKT